jgi:hypothetical protein
VYSFVMMIHEVEYISVGESGSDISVTETEITDSDSDFC